MKLVLLVGGVGGAKLALGLMHSVPPDDLTIIVNTGDDFWHYGLRVCPDLDTVTYTLGGLVDTQQGWGLADDTLTTLDMLRTYGEDTWFRLGDKDIATHMLRTHWLREGLRLTEITHRLTQALNIAPRILPMSDDPVATIVDTHEHGELAFQTYFVKHRWQPTVRGLRFEGLQAARMTPEVSAAIANADAVIFGPSNPWLSIAPILMVPGLSEALRARDVPRVAVTPIVAGRAIKGPAAKLMAELGYEVSAQAVADYYGEVINGFVYDERDADERKDRVKTEPYRWKSVKFDTMMVTEADKIAVARRLLTWLERWE